MLTWRPFAPQPISPALTSFADCLAATPYEWYLRPDGRLRAREHGTEMCALTAVARYRIGRTYSVGDWIHAGESIGLSSADSGLIVAASDRRRASALVERLRQRLLMATLGKPGRRRICRAPHTTRDDAFQPALAERDGGVTPCRSRGQSIVSSWVSMRSVAPDCRARRYWR